MVFEALEPSTIQTKKHLYVERFTSLVNAIVAETTDGPRTPRILRRVLVTFHDGADPPVQQTVTSETVTLTFVSGEDDGYDHIINVFVIASGDTYEFLPSFIRNFKANDELLVGVTAPGANIFTSVEVQWAGGEV